MRLTIFLLPAFTCIFLLSVLPARVSVAQTNLLTNGSFETGSLADCVTEGVLPTPWFQATTASPGADVYSFDCLTAEGLDPTYLGNYDLLPSAPDGARFAAASQISSVVEAFGQAITPLAPGASYIVTGYFARSDSAYPMENPGVYDIYLSPTQNLVDGTLVATIGDNAAGSTAWTVGKWWFDSVRFTAPGNAATMGYIIMSARGWGSVWTYIASDNWALIAAENGVPLGLVNQTTADHQSFPAVAMGPFGEFAVAWQSDDQDFYCDDSDPPICLDVRGVYGRRFDSSGVPSASEFGLEQENEGGELNAAVAVDPVGNLVMAKYTPSTPDLSAELWSSTGSFVNEVTEQYGMDGSYRSPSVAMDDNGNFVMVWQSVNTANNSVGILGQTYNQFGVPQSGVITISGAGGVGASLLLLSPRVAMDADGDFVVVWSSLVIEADGQYDIAARRYDQSGVPQAGEFRVNTNTVLTVRDPDVAMASDGSFVVVWHSSTETTVYGKRYDSLGNELTPPVGLRRTGVGNDFQVPTFTGSSERFPKVDMNDNGDFIVGWNGNTPTVQNVAFNFQRFDNQGSPVGGQNVAIEGGGISAAQMDVGMDNNGNSVMVWSYDGDGGGTVETNDIHGRLYASLGFNTPVGTNVVLDVGRGVELTFDNVTSGGSTVVEFTDGGPTLPAEYLVGTTPPTYFDITTTAGFTGDVTICVDYDPADLQGAERDLKILHYDEVPTPQWELLEITQWPYDGEMCLRTTSLSPFVLATPVTPTAIQDQPRPVYFLDNSYPNPFNPTTTIHYGIEERAHVTLRIYDATGRLVRTLVDKVQPPTPGGIAVPWNGTNNSGNSVASGVYFYRLVAGQFVQTKKMVLLK